MNVDLLIENGLVIDGSGRQGQIRPVAVKGDRILLPDPEAEVAAAARVDARGLVVAPGFIDIHSHTTIGNLLSSRGGSKLSQGITTEITGNCGLLPPPPSVSGGGMELSMQDIDWSPQGFGKYLEHFSHGEISMNIGYFIGHGSIRAGVMGYANRKPRPAELEKMKDLVTAAMEHGAMGLSSGLVYPPGMFADTHELVELCKVVARYGGIYVTHMRSESNGVLEAVDEAIEIARRAGLPLQISHLKATGRQNWGKVALALAKLEAAEREGVEANCDFYPYTASSTGLSSQLPNWVHAGGWEAARRRLTDPNTRARIIAEIKTYLEESVGWQSIVVSSIHSKENQALEGKSLEEIGAIRGQHPVEALLDLLVEERGTPGMIKFSMSPEDVGTVAGHRLSMVGSDGVAIALNDPNKRKPHPRNFGAFPRVFRLFYREQGLLSLEAAVHKMTGAPAAKLNLPQRGLIEEGYFADLVLFSAQEIGDASDYGNPHQLSRGIHSVYVNGKLAYEEGRFLDPRSGVLVKPGKN
ncbi:MAG: N-acyl-D-amino-acid deacylase family protein [Bacillota bacterium]|jgi:N-acyl-D-amino-acid deacylase